MKKGVSKQGVKKRGTGRGIKENGEKTAHWARLFLEGIFFWGGVKVEEKEKRNKTRWKQCTKKKKKMK